jgi:hypothetical protein
VTNIKAAINYPVVIPAQAGIQFVYLIVFDSNQPYDLDSRLRGNDGYFRCRVKNQRLPGL